MRRRARQRGISTLASDRGSVQDIHRVRPSIDMHPDPDPGLQMAAGDAAVPGPPAARVPLLLIIGPPGVGKSSTARQVSRVLEHARLPFAYVDRDDFGADGLLHEDPLVGLQRILCASVTGGARRLVVAWRIESDAELRRFRAALPWADVTVCRLRAEMGALLERIAAEQRSFQRMHLQSLALEIAPRLDQRACEDILVATDEASPQAVALRALRQWTVAQR
jgi:predicted Ser/Thr protein kinase